jgi:hypothetical protein
VAVVQRALQKKYVLSLLPCAFLAFNRALSLFLPLLAAVLEIMGFGFNSWTRSTITP